MGTAERNPGEEPGASAETHPRAEPGASRRWAWSALAAILTGGLALRLWGIRQGLPFAYNADEHDHFVPHAVEMFRRGTLDPHYFANPPAFTYLLHFLYALWYGSAHAVVQAYAVHPGELYTLARVAAALLGTLAVWLLYLLGARLFGRAAGLLAAAVEAVAFLPVFYAHLALNDVPTLAPLTLSLLGTAGVLRKGRLRDHLLAGIGLGLACATKYTAGIVLVPYLAATLLRVLDGGYGERRRALAGLAVLAASAAGAFVLANPYSLLDYSSFHHQLLRQSSQSAEAQGKLGAPKSGGLLYYLWSLTWGLGWVPALAALAGAVAIWRGAWRVAWLLVPAPLLYLAFMGTQGRYFGRWLMPALPFLCLLAAYAAVRLLGALARATRRDPGRAAETPPQSAPASPGSRRRAGPSPRPAIAAGALVTLLLLAQGLLYSAHAGLVLSRADTRTLTRQWMLANVGRGANVVVEPVSPDQWADEARGAPAGCPGSRYRWCKWPSLYSFITPTGTIDPAGRHEVGIENYVRTLAPALIGYYEANRFCWVVTGSTEAGRAFADPGAVPNAVAYYRALAAQGQVVYRASPYARGASPVRFNFDWSFDYYPLAYYRPGPAMVVYRLHGGRCG
jgi:Dolichyl-phosphate-mannose-protein mannosyltransferase